VSGRLEQPGEFGLGHPQQGSDSVGIDAQLGSDAGSIGSGVVQPQDRGVYLGELLECGREVHTSTLGRADGDVGSSCLLDFANPATPSGCPGYPIWLESCAAAFGAALTGTRSEIAKIGASSSRRPMPSFAYT
jgi:hypothetical protein